MNTAASIALVNGKEYGELPRSLYVPPEAMKVMLDNFEGPLDLLHYLIRRDNIDILDIPVAQITKQYLEYVEQIVEKQIELAADYLLMSATLIEIKSKMLVAIHSDDEDEQVEDPRAELVRRLLEYSKIKNVAQKMDAMPRYDRDFLYSSVAMPDPEKVNPKINLKELGNVFLAIKDRAQIASEFQMQYDSFTVREAMAHLLLKLRSISSWLFSKLLTEEHASRSRVGVFFLAVLQLAKEQVLTVDQVDEDEITITAYSTKD